MLEYTKSRALALTERFSQPDQTRGHVSWETLVFTIPDDGTGSLPLLRHIIVNDNKSSSYKLGLLRVLTRIAESAPGIVVHSNRPTSSAFQVGFPTRRTPIYTHSGV